MIRRVARRGRPPQRIPDAPSVAAEDVLTAAKWQNICWRTGTKGNSGLALLSSVEAFRVGGE